MFILSAQRKPESVVASFRGYRDYLKAHASGFPIGAWALACSDWYFDASHHRCPHDSWLEKVTISEASGGKRNEERSTSIKIRLLGAYHDGYIELIYPQVLSYSLSAVSCGAGQGDWLYDEFRLGAGGRVIHEIEWGMSGQANSPWVIEASDVEFQWVSM